MGQAFVDSHGDAGAANSITVSEGHGYGMLILVQMAPVDPEAHATFD